MGAMIEAVVAMIKVLVWAAAVIDAVVVVELLVIDVRTDMVIGAWIDALAGVIKGFVSGIGVEVLAGANINVFASLMPALEFAVPKPIYEFSC